MDFNLERKDDICDVHVKRDVEREYSCVELRQTNFRVLEFDLRNGDEGNVVYETYEFGNLVNQGITKHACFCLHLLHKHLKQNNNE